MAKELTGFFALAWVAIFVATFATLGGGKIGAELGSAQPSQRRGGRARMTQS